MLFLMRDLKRMRLLCGLRQMDLSGATGVSTYKISAAETGRLSLSELEERALRGFLVERWESIVELEAQSGRHAVELVHAGV
jgi:predicted transcriptional regulator